MRVQSCWNGELHHLLRWKVERVVTHNAMLDLLETINEYGLDAVVVNNNSGSNIIQDYIQK